MPYEVNKFLLEQQQAPGKNGSMNSQGNISPTNEKKILSMMLRPKFDYPKT